MEKQLEHPYAWINLDALDANIQYVNEQCGQKMIRIATKSIRSVEALKYIEKRLIKCSGFMTFTAAETLFLIEQGLNHFLIGYPVYEEHSIKKIAKHLLKGVDVTFMLDHIEQAKLLQQIAVEMEVIIPICIDLNVSAQYPFLYFGTKRSPINTMEQVELLLHKLKACHNLKITGVMGYDAQIAGVADHYDSATKTALVKLLKKRSKKKVPAFRRQAVHFVKQNHTLKIVNAGGSGSIQYSSLQQDVTEITVGSAFFTPHLFDRYDTLQTMPAVGFALRVVRQYSDDTFVLQGGGYIASGAINEDRMPKFLEKDRFTFMPLEGAGEVQSPIIDSEKKLKIGDTVLLRHAKAGELCERFLTLHAFRGMNQEIYEGPYTTYRGDGQCFL